MTKLSLVSLLTQRNMVIVVEYDMYIQISYLHNFFYFCSHQYFNVRYIYAIGWAMFLLKMCTNQQRSLRHSPEDGRFLTKCSQ